jgi:hypothetical protein
MRTTTLFSILLTGLAMQAVLPAHGQDGVGVTQPAQVQGMLNFGSTFPQGWGTDLYEHIVPAHNVVLALDNTVADSLACNALVNASEINGNIAFLYRGACDFSQKALNAQNAGAVAVVVVNNVEGVFNMGAGSMADQVSIPVVMIGQSDGALLRPHVDAGTLRMFVGRLDENIGISRSAVSAAEGFAIPRRITDENYSFHPFVSMRVTSQTQQFNSFSRTVTITRNGQVVYQDNVDIVPGFWSPSGISYPEDMAPAFTQQGIWEAGAYTVTFEVDAPGDVWSGDDTASVRFWVNDDGVFSMSALDPATQTFTESDRGLRASNFQTYRQCIAMNTTVQDHGYSADGVSFVALANEGLSLLGRTVEVELYSYEPYPFGSFYYASEVLLASTTHVFDVDVQKQQVRVDFPTPVALPSQVPGYLACVHVEDPQLFLVYDSPDVSNYWEFPIFDDNALFPVNIEGQSVWERNGFGKNAVPQMVLHLSNEVITTLDPQAQPDLLPTIWPNPTDGPLTLQFGTAAQRSLMVMDATGKQVMHTTITTHRHTLDLAPLTSGMYLLHVAEGEQVQRLKVIRR